MVSIRRITTADPLYPQECALRQDVLLSIVGIDMDGFRGMFPGIEDRFEHFVAVAPHTSGPRVVGCVALLPDYPDPGVGKLMQMAVDRQRQGEGIGRKLVADLERRAFGELNLRRLFCHAQLPACGFYEKLGWSFDSEVFTEAGVPHRRMIFQPPPDGDESHF